MSDTGVTPSRRAAWPTVAEDVTGREAFEPVAGFGAEGAEVEVGQVGRDFAVLHRGGAAELSFRFLLADVAGVLDFELNVGGGFGRRRGSAGQFGDEVAGDNGDRRCGRAFRCRGWSDGAAPIPVAHDVAQAPVDLGRGGDAQALQPGLGGITRSVRAAAAGGPAAGLRPGRFRARSP